MTEQAKNILLSAAAEIETMYNQGILDGITLIRNMFDQPTEDGEVIEWTPELIKDTCDAFIEKYTAGEDGIVGSIPDVPNMVEEIPDECKEAGMSQDAYADLMSFLSDNMVEDVDVETVELSEVVPVIEEEEPVMMDVSDALQNAMIETEDGQLIPFEDCITVEVEEE